MNETIIIIAIFSLMIHILFSQVFKNKWFMTISNLVSIIAFLLIICNAATFYKIQIWFYIFSAPIAYLMYLLSCIIVGTKLNRSNLLFCEIWPLSATIRKPYFKETLRNIYTSFVEEIVYRGILYYLLYYFLHNTFIAVIVTSVCFLFVHHLKEAFWIQRIDIGLFSVLITVLFALSHSIIGVILVHILRNQFIILQKYCKSQIQLNRIEKMIRSIQKDKPPS